jgi:hypothetical protein
VAPPWDHSVLWLGTLRHSQVSTAPDCQPSGDNECTGLSLTSCSFVADWAPTRPLARSTPSWRGSNMNSSRRSMSSEIDVPCVSVQLANQCK